MSDIITLTGIVATDPRHIITAENLAITTFRLASTQRRFDKKSDRWVDADTNWYTITAFRQLAINASASLRKGERAVVTGRLRIREWDNGERKGTTVDIEAEALGHDLAWGSSAFSRTISSSSAPATDSFPSEEQAAEQSAQNATESQTAAHGDDESPDTPAAATAIEHEPRTNQFATADVATPF